MSNKIILSIIIPTKNRADLLRKLLESIERQPADQDIFEVIVIDNGSTDDTEDAVKEYQGKIRNCRYFYDARPGLHVGRNRGILESRGDIIGYLDDDEIPFPNWINTILEAFEDEEVMYVGGCLIPYDMSLLTPKFRDKYEIQRGSFRYIYSISCYWEEGISENDMRVHRTPRGAFFGGNSAYRKSVLCACGGFHPDSMPKHLLMYRGDGETYVAKYILEHEMKAMYYAQASIYHMIDVNRVSKSYIHSMYFRIGISEMYTCLRERGLKGGIVFFLKALIHIILRRKFVGQIQGELYLLMYYIFYKRVRHWVHKKDYF